jgi:hypothetical protein
VLGTRRIIDIERATIVALFHLLTAWANSIALNPRLKVLNMRRRLCTQRTLTYTRNDSIHCGSAQSFQQRGIRAHRFTPVQPKGSDTEATLSRLQAAVYSTALDQQNGSASGRQKP